MCGSRVEVSGVRTAGDLFMTSSRLEKYSDHLLHCSDRLSVSVNFGIDYFLSPIIDLLKHA